jgi:hypothetical protein
VPLTIKEPYSLGTTFILNDKLYHISVDGRFYIQLGRKDKNGKIRYLPHASYSYERSAQAVAWFNGYNMGPGYVKRLSYTPSANHHRHELAKVEG